MGKKIYYLNINVTLQRKKNNSSLLLSIQLCFGFGFFFFWLLPPFILLLPGPLLSPPHRRNLPALLEFGARVIRRTCKPRRAGINQRGSVHAGEGV